MSVRCQQSCYEAATTKSKRSASIGYGKRFQHMLAQAAVKTPSPFQYTIPSEFQKRPTSRAYTFGVSREYFKKVYLKENPPVDESKPGPNQY